MHSDEASATLITRIFVTLLFVTKIRAVDESSNVLLEPNTAESVDPVTVDSDGITNGVPLDATLSLPPDIKQFRQ